MMEPAARIYVAGHGGLVGSAIVRQLRKAGYHNLLLRSRRELDLTRQQEVEEFFAAEKPEYVFLAAARVGGIRANSDFPAEFIRDNIEIQNHIIHESWRQKIKKLLFLGSSCIYPKHAPQPIPEEALLSGPLEPSNRAYAVAKIAGIEMCRAYNQRYGTRFIAAMPTNLYGPGDNYDRHQSHVIPALIRKMHEAKVTRARQVEIWGTGTPRREFLYSDDAADACIHLMNCPEESLEETLRPAQPPLVNVGSGWDLTIRELAIMISEVVGVQVDLAFNAGQPDGTPRKLLDVSRLTSLNWKPAIPLREGLQLAYADFCRSQDSAARPEPFSAQRSG